MAVSILAPADARRLRSSLARLASNHDGEVLASVAAVGRILDKAGLGFADLGVVPALPPPRPVVARAYAGHQHRAYLLLHCGFGWSVWSREFLLSIAGWRKPLSVKQAERLREMEVEASAWLAGEAPA